MAENEQHKEREFDGGSDFRHRMMRNDGGTAFPSNALKQHRGMTLRDYFAAAALGGVAASQCWDGSSPDLMATYAYRLADAMLKERER